MGVCSNLGASPPLVIKFTGVTTLPTAHKVSTMKLYPKPKKLGHFDHHRMVIILAMKSCSKILNSGESTLTQVSAH